MPLPLSAALRKVSEVWITTSRPYNRLDNVDPDTVEWLRRRGIEYDGLLYDNMKLNALRAIVGKERIVGVVDDLASVYDEAMYWGMNPLLMTSWHNRAVHREHVASTLESAAVSLTSTAEEWTDRHGR